MIYNIYVIICKSNGKKYYGRSQEIEKRFRAHRNMLRKNEHRNMILQSDWNLYGEEDFIFEIIHSFTSLEESIKKEQYYIDSNLGIGYNIGCAKDGGDRMKFNPRKEETRKLKSRMFSGKGNPMYGKPKTEKMINSVKEANSKKVMVDGVVFNSVTECAKHHGLKANTTSYRIKSKSERFKNWTYVND